MINSKGGLMTPDLFDDLTSGQIRMLAYLNGFDRWNHRTVEDLMGCLRGLKFVIGLNVYMSND